MRHFLHNDSRSSSNPAMATTTRKDSKQDQEGRSTDDLLVQLSRLELFVDLVWVGIVANLSATFGDQCFTDSGVSVGEAIGEYLLLFLPVWRLWDSLREYGGNYYNDDLIQRFFVIWILALSVIYGINAPHAFVLDGNDSLRLIIAVYLIARGSFALAIICQAISLPFLRRQALATTLAALVGGAFLIAAMYTEYPTKLVLLILANAIEHPIGLFFQSPLADRFLLGDGWRKTPDHKHYIERMEGFFILILGEGVVRLIAGSPSGIGLNHRTGSMILALMLYYNLHWIYFNGDQSREFVHALRREWWRASFWKTFHVFLYSALLILAASVLRIVQDIPTDTNTIAPTSAETVPASGGEANSVNSDHYDRIAMWSASGSLGVGLFAMTVIALLNRSLDKPRTLLINYRWIRLAPRIPALAVILCLPLFSGISGATWIGGAVATLYVMFLFEWIAGMERDWKLVEPTNEK